MGAGLGQFLVGVGLGALIAGLGYWRGALSRSGAIAAAVVGALVVGAGGISWGVLLVAFFASSSALSFYNPARKAQVTEKFEKGHQRDVGQVLANGGWLALLALWSLWRPDPWLFAAAVGALAAANADTWATELGVLNPTPPRLITTFEPVPPGTNGAISRLGTIASATGALLIGFLATVLTVWGYDRPGGLSPFSLTMAGLVGGVAGALFDSLLGATVQRVGLCPRCNEETEKLIHDCGTPVLSMRGLAWLDNDWVNFFATVVGSLAAATLAAFWPW